MNKKTINFLTSLFIFILFAVFCFYELKHNSTTTNTTNSTHTNAIVQYPDPNKTPGVALDGVTAAQVCQSGYSKGVRNVTVDEKKQVYAEYGLTYPQAQGAYEVDHFIPLELGGSNDIKNLWPEPAEPTPGFHQKDIVENFLHEKVCSGQEDLKQAQDQITKDWYAVFTSIPNPSNYAL